LKKDKKITERTKKEKEEKLDGAAAVPRWALQH